MDADILMTSGPQLTLIWLGLFIILIIIELFTVGLTTIWFAAGSLAALAANALGAGLPVQIILFLAVSCVLLVFTRPWALKHLNRRRTLTNYEGEIGKVVRITERVDNLEETGACMADGKEWSVRSNKDSETLEPGTLAKVVSISGVKLIVEKYEEEQKS